jgi:hypothetical protein
VFTVPGIIIKATKENQLLDVLFGVVDYVIDLYRSADGILDSKGFFKVYTDVQYALRIPGVTEYMLFESPELWKRVFQLEIFIGSLLECFSS